MPYYFPLKNLKLIKRDIRLWKKFPVLYREHFGFLCRGYFKQSFFSWGALLWLAGSVFVQSIPAFLLGVLGVILFKFFVEMSGKRFSLLDGCVFVVCSFARDLLFPLFFSWFFLQKAVGLK